MKPGPALDERASSTIDPGVRTPRRPLRLVSALAAHSLRHEWVLTLCLVIALAAVIAPLLVLLGLKHGTIETLRDRLVEDPVFREIRPAQTREYPPEWFDTLRTRGEVAFLTPTILPLSSVLGVEPAGGGRAELLDLVPTAAGDPLLLENGGAIPADGEVVLSAEAARRAGVKAGDAVRAKVTRSRAGRNEVAEAQLRVAAVLDARAGTLPRVYAPLSFVLDVEAYKEGYGAPARGWAGDAPEPYLSFDGAVLLLDEPLPPIARSGLIINTGFGRIVELEPGLVSERLGFTPPAGLVVYDLITPGATVTLSSLRAIEQKLRGQQRMLLPYVRDLVLRTGEGEPLQLIGLSIDAEQAARLGLPALPWGGFAPTATAPERLRSVLLPNGGVPGGVGGGVAGGVDGGLAGLSATAPSVAAEGVAALAFALTPAGHTALAHAVVPVELLGVLRTARQRAVLIEAGSGRFEMARGGFRGFRLYARSIDDVPALYHALAAEGIETMAEVEAIERIQVLDTGLSRLFWLIALLSVSGGTAVLVASLYAAVERRRRDLGVLRLLGLARGHVFFFPVAQGLMIAVLGLAASFAGYGLLAGVINRSFASELAPGEAFCALPWAYPPLASAITLVLAALASLVAAWRATRVDPADAIREQ